MSFNFKSVELSHLSGFLSVIHLYPKCSLKNENCTVQKLNNINIQDIKLQLALYQAINHTHVILFAII